MLPAWFKRVALRLRERGPFVGQGIGQQGAGGGMGMGMGRDGLSSKRSKAEADPAGQEIRAVKAGAGQDGAGGEMLVPAGDG